MNNGKTYKDGHKQKMPKPYFHKFKNHGKEKYLEMAINIICKTRFPKNLNKTDCNPKVCIKEISP